MQNDPNKNLEYKDYLDLYKSIEVFTKIILQSFKDISINERDIIIGNLIAKTLTCLRSVLVIWKVGDFDNFWCLFRLMLDRLFHLQYLFDTNSFKEFEEWSFIRWYKMRIDAKSDTELQKLLSPREVEISSDDKKRFKSIKQNNNWRRPKANDIAKSMDLVFLYKYGYDYASTLVHPMATDGELNFEQILKDEIVFFDEQKSVIQNSFLIFLLLTQKGLNASTFKWRRIVYEFIDECLAEINSKEHNYNTALNKIILMNKDMSLCEKRTTFADSI